MVTKVGMQSNFADALKDLLELDYDAVEAYDAAIKRLENDNYKQKMTEFSADHKRHIEEISVLLESHDVDFESGPSAKQWLTKGKVVLADMMGDSTILKAMLSNEEDTNTAYERINNHKEVWDDAQEILKRGLADERKHKEWLSRI
jgi:rubrerythrin